MHNKQALWLTPLAIVGSAVSCYAVQYLTVEQAQQLCFKEATQFASADVLLTDAQKEAIQRDSGVNVRFKAQQLWRAYLDKQFLGWFIVDNVVGKHEFITWVLALNADGSVRQIEILDYRETYGGEVRSAKWRAQFVGKKYGAALKLDDDIQNISGATLSSRHITDGVKRLLSLYEHLLKS